MKRIGVYIAIFGIAAIILPFFNLQLMLLTWVDNWGETVSWIIKLGLIVIGVVIFILAKKQEEPHQLGNKHEE